MIDRYVFGFLSLAVASGLSLQARNIVNIDRNGSDAESSNVHCECCWRECDFQYGAHQEVEIGESDADLDSLALGEDVDAWIIVMAPQLAGRIEYNIYTPMTETVKDAVESVGGKTVVLGAKHLHVGCIVLEALDFSSRIVMARSHMSMRMVAAPLCAWQTEAPTVPIALRSTLLRRRLPASVRPFTGATAAVCVVGTVAGSIRLRRHFKRVLLRRSVKSTAALEEATVAMDPGLGEWCALVINLERRADRLDRLKRLLSATNPWLWQRIERIDAVDGKLLSFDDEVVEQVLEERTLERARRAKELGLYTVVHDTDNKLVHFDDHFTEGAVACAMSHRNALERVATHPTAEWGLILEDDVSIVLPHLDRAIARLLQSLPYDWQAVYLGYHDDDGTPHTLGLSSSDASSADQAAEIVEVEVGGVYRQCWGLYAWMVRKEAAQALLDNLFPLSTQVDGAISSFLVRVYGPGRVFKVPPEALWIYSSSSEEAQDSDIQTMKCDEDVIDSHGTWAEYMRLTQEPSPYDDWSNEDMYALFGEFGAPDAECDLEADDDYFDDDVGTEGGDGDVDGD